MSYWSGTRVLVTGGDGFLGRNLVPRLKALGADVAVAHVANYDLTKETDTERLFSAVKPQLVIHLAADVGGIAYLRDNASSVMRNNLLMNTHVLDASQRHEVAKLVTLASVNCYPHDAEPPFRESELWSGLPEESVRGYGVAKRLMILQSQLCRAQHGLVTVNLILDGIYGPHDVFDPKKSRVIPANIRRFADAKRDETPAVSVWGTGAAIRDYVYVDDAVDAIIGALERVETSEPINIGTGHPVPMRELVETIAHLVGYGGEIAWDATKPEGQLKRYLDVTKAKELGLLPKTALHDGLKKTIAWHKENF